MTVLDLPSPLHDYLRGFVSRRRRFALLRAAGTAMAFFVAFMLAACLADRFLQVSPVGRAILLAVDLSVSLGILLPALWRSLRRRIDWLEAASDIERCNPAFTQQLQTVVSQLMERSDYRGSSQMLQHLLGEVTDNVQRDQPHHWIRWRRVTPPWIAAAVALMAGLLLACVPALGMPTLLQRFIWPLRPIAPVTTTRIYVAQHDLSLPRGSTLLIRARVERLSTPSVDIYTSHDRKSWSRIAMQPLPDYEYLFTLPALDRNLWYFIVAGDASTPICQVTALRPPAVVEYRIRYEYPAYTKRGIITLSNTDGVIEALMGTKVHLALAATEPLSSAVLILGDTVHPMTPTADPNVRQVEFVVAKSQIGTLEMTSAGGLTTRLVAGVSVRSQADREPLARLLQPVDDLRLSPREHIDIQYQVLDDYGAASVSVAAQVNAGAVARLPIRLQGDPRRQEGYLSLDLAALNVKVGDVLSIALEADDCAGQKARSASRSILISPRSIDIDTHHRVAELKQAAQLAATTRQELQRAGDSLNAANRAGEVPDATRASARLQASRSLANTMEAALLLHQSLLRACAKSASPQQTRALAECVDRARVLVWTAERLAAINSSDSPEYFPADRLRWAIETAKYLAHNVKVLSEGEQAAVILAERNNLRTPPAAPSDAVERMREEMLRRAREDINWAVKELALKPETPRLDDQLKRKVEAAEQLVRTAKTIDFWVAAMEWAAALRLREPVPSPLAERLSSAASVEALRPDRNLVAARDLQLASAAASRLAELAMTAVAIEDLRGDLMEFPKAISALQSEAAIYRLGLDTDQQATDATAIAQAADAARQKLAGWAGQTDAALLASGLESTVQAEDLALQASAETARRKYSRATALDQQLLQRIPGASPQDPTPLRQVRTKMDSVQAIDLTFAEQEQLRKQTIAAPGPQQAQELAQQQKRVAEKIEKIGTAERPAREAGLDAESRRAATAALQEVQEQLAHMPQQITAVLEAAAEYRESLERVQQVLRDAEDAPPELLSSIAAELEQAQRDVKEAEREATATAAALSPAVAERMAQAIRPFEPEAEEAATALTQRLGPALKALQRSVTSTEAGSVDRTAASVRNAIEYTQWLLRESQFRLTERDPLVAARWFAEAASQALAARPPDLPRARTHQESAHLALNYAWQNSVRQAAAERLAVTPTFRSLLGSQASDVVDGQSVRSLGQMVRGVRQWGFLRQRSTAANNAAVHRNDPPDYREALRLYFDTLAKTQEEAE